MPEVFALMRGGGEYQLFEIPYIKNDQYKDCSNSMICQIVKHINIEN